jgi:hypothetical protein
VVGNNVWLVISFGKGTQWLDYAVVGNEQR